MVIAAPILAPSAAEAETLVCSVTRLVEHGAVILADGGSIDGFEERLSSITGVTVRATPGTGPRLAAQARQALTMAAHSGAPQVLYTEPDKRWFFENRLADFLARSNTDASGFGVSLPARDAASFATFPPGQQTPERLFNTLAGETLGLKTDLLHGPLLLPAELVAFLGNVSLNRRGSPGTADYTVGSGPALPGGTARRGRRTQQNLPNRAVGTKRLGAGAGQKASPARRQKIALFLTLCQRIAQDSERSPSALPWRPRHAGGHTGSPFRCNIGRPRAQNTRLLCRSLEDKHGPGHRAAALRSILAFESMSPMHRAE